jgi:hypothetical protein
MPTLNSQITALHSIGADAMDNLYDIIIALPSSMAEKIKGTAAEPLDSPNLLTQLRLRADGFTPPKLTQKKYEVRYKTVGMNRPSARIEGEREFTLTFRLDAYYRVYHALLAWRSLLFEPATGYATQHLPDEAEYYGQVTIYALGNPPELSATNRYTMAGVTSGGLGPASANEGIIGVKAWEFNQVWISDVTHPEFKNGAGELQKVSATFQFGEYIDPSYSWADDANSAGAEE